MGEETWRLKPPSAQGLGLTSFSLPPASSAAVGSGPPPEAEQAWPQSSGEEELQLQLALAMSKEEADQVPGLWCRGSLFCHPISMLHPSLLFPGPDLPRRVPPLVL